MFPGVVIDYHVGFRRFQTVILEGLIVCADPGVPLSRGCGGSDALSAVQGRIRSIAFPGADVEPERGHRPPRRTYPLVV